VCVGGSEVGVWVWGRGGCVCGGGRGGCEGEREWRVCVGASGW